jgi:hypothetical protein
MSKTKKKSKNLIRTKSNINTNTNTKSKKLIKKNQNKTQKKTQKIYTKDDYNSGDGMLTTVWGPSLWHYLHIMSFNYPVNPTKEDKTNYKNFILSLQNVLPCKWCRMNLKNNLKQLPLTEKRLKNRESFSRYLFELHELINKMLGKKSGLTYDAVRERYEHFRSRCTIDMKMKQADIHKLLEAKKKIKKCNLSKKKTIKKEKGCTEPLYGKKSKCIIKIVPQEEKGETFQMDNKCIKLRIKNE